MMLSGLFGITCPSIIGPKGVTNFGASTLIAIISDNLQACKNKITLVGSLPFTQQHRCDMNAKK